MSESIYHERPQAPTPTPAMSAAVTVPQLATDEHYRLIHPVLSALGQLADDFIDPHWL